MERALIAAATFLMAAGISAVTITPIRNFAERFQLFDIPGARRIHSTPRPRIGGLAIYFGFIVAIGLTFVLPVDRFAAEIERIVVLIIGATIVLATMFYDDVIGIKPLPKLALQIGAAGLVILPRLHGEDIGIVIERFNVPYIGTVELPLAIAFAFTIFWIVGMMNALNWADGLDGLAGSITLVAALILFLHTYFKPAGNPQFTISLLAIALAGAVIGFLPWNWHPSKIIMGDTGAMFLGFALATISIIGGAKIATALLALGVPIVDMAWVILYRLLNGRSPADRGMDHLHHRLLSAGWSQPQVVSAYVALALAFGIVGLLLPTRESKLVALVLLGLVVLAVVGWQAWRGSRRGQIDHGAGHTAEQQR